MKDNPELTENQVLHVRELLQKPGGTIFALKYLSDELGEGVRTASDYLNKITQQINDETDWKYAPHGQLRAGPSVSSYSIKSAPEDTMNVYS